MHKQNFAEAVAEIIKVDARYDRDAYLFVREGLDYTLKLLKKAAQTNPVHRHVSGQELLDGMRQFALDQFGPMTKTVLDHWGIRKCEDFGEIVFNMVEKGILGKTDQDSRADFRGGFDFNEAFVRPFQPSRQPRRHEAPARHVTPAEPTRDSSRAADSKKLSSGSN
ncbi:MAG: Minf_1886 family protein [Verrucomicrobiota bacterium]